MFFNSVFQKPQWVLGLMSGTSADGVDGALLRVDQNGVMDFGPTLYRPYSREMQQRIVSAMGNPDFLDTELVKDITNEHVWLAKDLVEQSGTAPVLIGFHGQTLYHVPRQNGQKARTLQVGDGAQLADQLNIPVVDQFRVADVEKGGEGAPLVPIFHQTLLETFLDEKARKTSAVVNIGGVCNVTFLDGSSELTAGDVGPGCCLLDDWLHRQNPQPTYEELSQMANEGQVREDLLMQWLGMPFFQQPLPKSADRLQWHSCLGDVLSLASYDAAATLANFTTQALVVSLPHYIHTLYVAGGGRHHRCLMKRLSKYYNVVDIEQLGCCGDFVEAYAFALLAMRSVLNFPLSFPKTTGVCKPISGGALNMPKTTSKQI